MCKRQKWHPCIGPWGAVFLQVGDSEEHNGSDEIVLKAGKRNLLDKKGDLGLPLAIEKQDIMTLMNWAWDKSFTHVECN
jgi:hypothetical protein